MNEQRGKALLRKMLASLGLANVLHILRDLVDADADAARRANDLRAEQQRREVAATLWVVGLGVQALPDV